MRTKTKGRNREIFAAYQAGQSPETLADHYGLALSTLEQLLRNEKHKLAVSGDDFYRKQRRETVLLP